MDSGILYRVMFFIIQKPTILTAVRYLKWVDLIKDE